MKRILFCLLITGLLLTPVLSGCAAPAPATPAAPKTSAAPTTPAASLKWEDIIAKEKLQKFVAGYGSEGGKAYVMGAGFAALITKYTDIQASMTKFPSMIEAGPSLNKGDVDFTSVSGSQPMAAYRGDAQEKVRLRIIANGGGKASSFVAFHTISKAGIKSGADLRGKKIVYVPISYALPVIEGVLRANNLTMKDVTVIPSSSGEVAVDWIIEGKADVLLFVVGTAAQLLDKRAGLYLIPLTPKEIEEAIKGQEYVAGIIPKGMFGNPADTPGLVAPLCWWLRAGINNITAYTMTKVFWEHVKEFHLVHDACTGYIPESNLTAWYVPWHAGAIRYYQEIGTWKPEYTAKTKELIATERKLYGDVPDEAAFRALKILD